MNTAIKMDDFCSMASRHGLPVNFYQACYQAAERMMAGEVFYGRLFRSLTGERQRTHSFDMATGDFLDYRKALADHGEYIKGMFKGCLYEAGRLLSEAFSDDKDWSEWAEQAAEKYIAEHYCNGVFSA
jgi:hypothetical protein